MYFLSTSIGDFGAMPHPMSDSNAFFLCRIFLCILQAFYVGGDPSGLGAVAQTLGLCMIVPCAGRAFGPSPARPAARGPGRAGPLHNLAGRAGPGPTYCGPGPGLG